MLTIIILGETGLARVISDLKKEIATKKERIQELTQLIRVEQELNIEKEYKNKKENEAKIEESREEMNNTLRKLQQS